MSTQGKIKTLYSDINSEEALFPRTKTNAVSDQNGVGLDAILDKAVYTKSVNDNELNTAPVNADTLNGNNADYFASKSYVAVEIAKAKLDGEDINIDLSGYATKDDLNNLATKNEVKAIDFPVDSVNGKTGAVTLSASDVNARANTWMPTASDVGAATSNHTHNYAGSSSTGGAATSANKVNKNLVVKLNNGSTEGTNLFTFNGSAAKTVNVTASAIGAAASSHNHSASNITSGTLLVARGGTGVTTEALIGLKAYPVGSIYMAYDSTSPASRFGGTWTQIKDRFLLGVGSTYAAAKTGGAATVTLTEAQMPSHQHSASIVLGATGLGSHHYAPPTTNNTGTLKNDWTYYTHTSGGGEAHNNMPPYQTVYMWRRTA